MIITGHMIKLIYSWTFHELFMNCSWINVHELFQNCSCTIFKNCSWTNHELVVHELFMNYSSWIVHELTSSWTQTYELFKNHSWTVHDHFTGVVSRQEFPSEDDVPPGGETFPPLDIPEDELRDDPIIDNHHSDPENTPPPPPQQSGVTLQAVKRKRKKSAKVYSIAKILGKLINDSGQTEYKVRWANYGPTHNGFEPHDNLDVTTKKYVQDNDGIIPTCT